MTGAVAEPRQNHWAAVTLFRDVLKWTLRSAREHRDVSQFQFAQSVRLVPTTVSDLECGRGDPKLSTVIRALHALGYRLTIEEHDTSTAEK